MKKLLVLAMMATLLMAGSAFAVNRHLTPVPNATFSTGAPGVPIGPTTTNNDDSCDIGVAPAATLLLPYFEVDVTNRTQTTLFTITNVSRYPQIAHVTLWTDFSFPVLDFNIFLTGYDVQGINLLDVLTTGTIASTAGTGPTTAQSPLGTAGSIPSLTAPTPNAGPGFTNPNFSASIGCGSLPGVLPPSVITPVRTALTAGTYPGCASVGRVHSNAIGYATIDVASNCSTRLPNDPGGAYFSTDILFDNVLIGDYQQLGPAPAGTTASSFDAGGNAMVHIRAVPEGGGAGSQPGTNLPFTFYDRYTPATNRTIDRRQPLPNTWAARYIQGGAGAFATNYKIWREGFGTGASCASLPANGSLTVSEIVRFDEHENPFVNSGGVTCSPNCASGPVSLPETSATATSDTTIYPTLTGADVGGWMYLNLSNGGSSTYSVTRPGGIIVPGPTVTALGSPRPSQNWVIVEMFGNVNTSRLTVDFDAAWLGNGCSPQVGTSIANQAGGSIIGPAGGVFVCPPGTTLTNGTVTLCTGTNTTPIP